MKKIYISAGFYDPAMKQRIKERLGGNLGCFVLEDPEEAQTPRYPGSYVGRDLDLIDASDLILAVQSDYPYLYGMAAEMGYAAANGTPIIYVCLTKRVDSFLSGLARAVFTDLDAACDFIIERYAD